VRSRRQAGATEPHGADARRPDPEPVQVLGITRDIAQSYGEVLALHRAEMVNREPDARPVLHVLVTLEPVDDERFVEIMTALRAGISEVHPDPVALLAVQHGGEPSHPDLVAAVTGLDDPYWRRDA
jgi:hypothetical protein